MDQYEKERIYQGIRDADAAGDSEGVIRLGEYLAEIEAAEPPPPAAPTWKGGAREGALRTVAAGAARIPIGAGQLITFGLEAMDNPNKGPFNPSVRRYNAAAEDLLTSIRGKSYDNPDAPAAEWLTERGAELGLGMFMGTPSKTKQIGDVLLNAAKNSAIGAAASYDESETVAEKTGSIALGTLGGVGIAGALNAVPGAIATGYRWVMKRMMKNPDAAQAAAMADLQKMYPELAQWLTLGQKTGAPAMLETEARNAGRYAQAQYRQQASILKEALETYGERYGPNWDPEAVGSVLAERGPAAVRAEASNLSRIRKAEWDAMIGSAEAAVTARKIAAGGVEGYEQIMFDASKMDELLLRLGDDFNIPNTQLAPALQKMRREIEVFKGQLSIETLLDVLKKTNSENFNPLLGQVTAETQAAFGKAFRSGLFEMIDEAPDGTADAVTWIKRARQSYSQRSAQREAFRASVVAKTLGLEGPVADPAAALKAIVAASPQEQARFRTVLGEHDPQLLNEVRRAVWQQSMNSASDLSGPNTKAAFDPVSHAERMLRLVGTEADGLSGLFSKTEATQMRALLEPIRSITAQRGFMARALEMEGAGMSAAAAMASPRAAAPFVARGFIRLFVADIMDRHLHTASGRAMIMGTYQAIGTPKFDAMLGRLLATSDAQFLVTEDE